MVLKILYLFIFNKIKLIIFEFMVVFPNLINFWR